MVNKALFSSYIFNQPPSSEADHDDSDNDPPPPPSFQINLAFLLETLQILGAMDSTKRSEPSSITTGHFGRTALARQANPAPFSDRALGLSGTCVLTYDGEGGPLNITIQESGVKTTASLTTYVPEMPDDIPFDRKGVVFKIIMQPRALASTLIDFASMGASRLMVEVKARPQPRLMLYGKGGECGVTVYDFGGAKRDLLENIVVNSGEGDVDDGEGFRETYRFDMFKAASDAMKIASKLSLRGDRQGVLNMQFMVDVNGDESSFMDFKLVPDTDIEDDEYGCPVTGDGEMDEA
jgi:cell cycle checkpoint protein